jgi:hypothetical protein
VSITPETLAWLRQTAKFEGGVTAQVLLHLLERVEALEADATAQSQSSSFCNEAIVRRLEALEAAQRPPADHSPVATEMVSTPKAAPVATDEELLSVAELERFLTHAYRACYNLGRQHGAAQPRAALAAPPVAPAGELVDKICRQLPLRPVEIRAVIRVVAAWLDQQGQHGCSLLLRKEADQ